MMIKFSEIKPLRNTQLMAAAIYIGAPLLYLIAGYYIDLQKTDNPANDLMFNILILFSLIQPSLGFLIEKFHIGMYRRNVTNRQTPEKLFFTIGITKIAMVNAVFLYGLVVVIITGDFNNFYYFYLLGTVWAFILFPTKKSYDKFLEKINKP